MKVSALDRIFCEGTRYRGLIVWFRDDAKRTKLSNNFVVRGFGGWNVAEDCNADSRGRRSERRLKKACPDPKSLEAL